MSRPSLASQSKRGTGWPAGNVGYYVRSVLPRQMVELGGALALRLWPGSTVPEQRSSWFGLEELLVGRRGPKW